MSEQARRKELHHKVLELKGAIRVFCRVRPIMGKEALTGGACVSVRDEESLVVSVHDQESAKSTETGRRHTPTRGTVAGRRTVDEGSHVAHRDFTCASARHTCAL